MELSLLLLQQIEEGCQEHLWSLDGNDWTVFLGAEWVECDHSKTFEGCLSCQLVCHALSENLKVLVKSLCAKDRVWGWNHSGSCEKTAVLDFGVDVDFAKFFKDDLVQCVNTGCIRCLNSARLCWSQRAQEATGDAKTLKDNLWVFVLDRLLQKVCYFIRKLLECGLSALWDFSGAEQSSQNT